MRAPPIPSSLKWLIERHARLDGELDKIEEEEVQRLAAAKDCALAYEYKRDALLAEKSATELLIRQHEAGIDPAIIRSKRSQNNLAVTDYGQMTNRIYECLRQANGQPCTATHVASYAAVFLGIATTDEEFSDFRYRVRQRMKTLTWLGKLTRASNQVGSLEGRWCLNPDSPASSEPDIPPPGDAPASNPATSETGHCASRD